MDAPAPSRSFGDIPGDVRRRSEQDGWMGPSEYQELADFFVERLDRNQKEMRAQLERYQEETRTQFELGRQETRALGVTVESLRHEIRLVADGVLEANRRIDENTRAIEENGRHLDDHGRRLDDQGRRLDENTRAIEENSRRLDEHGRRLDENTRAVDLLTERVGRLEAAV
jgi:hypothetical protein